MLCFFSFLVKSNKTTPTIAKTGENEEGFNKVKKKLSPSIPDKLKNITMNVKTIKKVQI